MRMETFTKVIGLTIKPMGKECSWIRLEPGILGNGKMTCNMEQVKRVGTTVKLVTLVSFLRARRMERVGSNGKMVVTMRVTLWMGTSKATGGTILQTWR